MESASRDDLSISRVIELNAVLEQQVETSRVEARRIRMSAGFAPGRHVHNGHVVGSAVRGTVLFQIGQQPSRVLLPGEVFYEPAAVPIDHFDARDEDVEFLAFFLLREGETPEITFAD